MFGVLLLYLCLFACCFFQKIYSGSAATLLLFWIIIVSVVWSIYLVLNVLLPSPPPFLLCVLLSKRRQLASTLCNWQRNFKIGVIPWRFRNLFSSSPQEIWNQNILQSAATSPRTFGWKSISHLSARERRRECVFTLNAVMFVVLQKIHFCISSYTMWSGSRISSFF